MPSILLVVEGDGEVQAAPLLARRILHELHGRYEWDFITHRRRDLAHLRAQNWNHFRRYLSAAFNERMPILWLLDADDDCPLRLLSEIREVTDEIKLREPTAFTFWIREYETLFLHDPTVLTTRYGIAAIEDINEPEKIRGAKEWISKQLPARQSYKPTVDQAAMTAGLDIGSVRDKYRSLAHFEKTLLWLIDNPPAEMYPGL